MLCVAGALLLAGCAETRGGSIPYDRPLAAPDPPKISALNANYKIAPLDKPLGRGHVVVD